MVSLDVLRERLEGCGFERDGGTEGRYIRSDAGGALYAQTVRRPALRATGDWERLQRHVANTRFSKIYPEWRGEQVLEEILCLLESGYSPVGGRTPQEGASLRAPARMIDDPTTLAPEHRERLQTLRATCLSQDFVRPGERPGVSVQHEGTG